MKITRIEHISDGTVNYGGLVLIINFLKRAGQNKATKESSQKLHARMSDFDVLATYCCLLAQSKSDYEHVRVFKDDGSFTTRTGLKQVPSAETLRQRLDLIGKNKRFVEAIPGNGETEKRRKGEVAASPP